MTTWADIRFFRSFEFDSPDEPGSGSRMSLDFVAKLDRLRSATRAPLIVKSGYRTPEHNATVGGVDSSAHETGHAADLGALSSGQRFQIVEAAMRIGFRRIGIGNGFVHLDDSLTHPQDVCWLYPSTDKRT